MNLKERFSSFVSRIIKRILQPQDIGGLEIAGDALRLAFLQQKGDTVEWHYFSARPLPAGIIIDGEVQNVDALSTHIKQLFDSIVGERKINNEVIISIPESNLYVHSLKIPVAVSAHDIPFVIMNSATQNLPYNLTDIYDANYAWQTVLISGFERRVILCLTKKLTVDRYLQAVELAGLQAVVLQTPTVGFEYCVAFPKGISIVYYVEPGFLTSCAYVEGKLVFKRTQKAAREPAVLADLIEKDSVRVKDFILAEVGDAYAVSLFVLSSLPETNQIIELLGKKNIAITRATLQKSAVPSALPSAELWIGLLGAAFRVLLPRRNDIFATLLPFSPKEQYLKKKISTFFSRTTKVVFATLLFYIVSFFFIGFLLSSTQQKVSADLRRQEAVQIPQDLLSLDKEIDKFNGTVAAIVAIKPQLKSVIPSLEAVNKVAFPGITLGEFTLTPQGNGDVSISINGSATTRDNFLSFKKALEDGNIFKSVDTPVQNIEQRENVTFTMTLLYAS